MAKIRFDVTINVNAIKMEDAKGASKPSVDDLRDFFREVIENAIDGAGGEEVGDQYAADVVDRDVADPIPSGRTATTK